MIARLKCQRGFSMVEVLLVSVLFLVVLTATLTSMANFERVNRTTERTEEQVESTRRAVDRGARQLRNLASRPSTGAATIARALPHDFVFQTSDPARTWVRMCTAPVSTGHAQLWMLSSPTPVAPTTQSCPGTTTDWPRQELVADKITNRLPGRDEAMFTYGRTCLPGAPATCATDLTSITAVNMEMLLDDDLTRKPAEVRVATGVFLRNQNERPVARFAARPSAMPRTVLLNGSASIDPEGRTLRYYWFRTDNYVAFQCGTAPKDGTVLGQGVTLNYRFADADGPSGTTTKGIMLVVCDPGDLQSVTQADVVIPT